MRTIYEVTLWLSAIPAVLSVVVYALHPWWRHPFGRHLFSYMTVLAALLLLSSVRQVVDLPRWMDFVHLGFFALLPIIMWWRLWVLIRASRKED